MPSSRDKDIEKRSAIIQGFFDKVSISKIKDLSYKDRDDSNSTTAFSAYRTSAENITVIDQGRLQRYREFEQMNSFATRTHPLVELFDALLISVVILGLRGGP